MKWGGGKKEPVGMGWRYWYELVISKMCMSMCIHVYACTYTGGYMCMWVRILCVNMYMYMGVLCVYFLVPRSWSLITSWDVNGPGFLGKMADFKAGAGYGLK